MRIQEKIAVQQYDSVQIILNMLNSSDPLINLNKQIIELWNQHLIENTVLSQEDSIVLWDVACSDPIVYGSGVYLARSILDWDGNCQVISQISTTNHDNKNFSVTDLYLFSNPAHKSFTIKASQPIMEMHIFSLSGYLLDFVNLKQAVYEHHVDLPNGIYLIDILFEDGSRTTEKMVIQSE